MQPGPHNASANQSSRLLLHKGSMDSEPRPSFMLPLFICRVTTGRGLRCAVGQLPIATWRETRTQAHDNDAALAVTIMCNQRVHFSPRWALSGWLGAGRRYSWPGINTICKIPQSAYGSPGSTWRTVQHMPMEEHNE